MKFPPFVSDEMVACIRALLQPKPSKRLGGGSSDHKELRKHPFFSVLNWKDFVAPSWVKNNVVNNTSPDHLRHFTRSKRYVNKLAMEIHSGRFLVTGPDQEPADSVYCEVRTEGCQENTAVIRGDQFPKWDTMFTFEVLSTQEFLYESDVVIQE